MRGSKGVQTVNYLKETSLSLLDISSGKELGEALLCAAPDCQLHVSKHGVQYAKEFSVLIEERRQMAELGRAEQ